MRRYAVEFIGTFFLVLTIGSTGLAAAPGVIAPLGHRGCADGDDLHGRPHLGRPLQPGSHAWGVPAGAVSCLGRAAILGRQLLGAAGAAWIIGFALPGAPVTARALSCRCRRLVAA
jgi:hypothetical protein